MVMAEELLDYVAKFKVVTDVGVHDSVDRLNYLFTVAILLVCAVIATVKQYLLKPISCYLSSGPGGSNLVEYMEYLCWVHGTFAHAMEVPLPEADDKWKEMEHIKVLYYQWVPFVLGLQCILFYLPRLMWQMICHNRTGTDLQHLITTASDAVRADTEARPKMVAQIARALDDVFFKHREIRSGVRAQWLHKLYSVCHLCVMSKRLGTWLVVSYFFMKFCYLLNALGQLYLMQRFLGFNSTHSLFGWSVLRNITQGHDWEVTQVFPRVTFCYTRVKHTAGTNAVTAQCVLPVNMLNEKIYIFLWFWISITFVLTFISIPVWFGRIGWQQSHIRFIKTFLKSNHLYPQGKDRSLVTNFTQDFLRYDGIFLLRMIALNAGDIVASEIVCELWSIFKKKYRDYNFSPFAPSDPMGKEFDYGGGPDGDLSGANNPYSGRPSSGKVNVMPQPPGNNFPMNRLPATQQQQPFQRHPSAPPEMKSLSRPPMGYQEKEVL